MEKKNSAGFCFETFSGYKPDGEIFGIFLSNTTEQFDKILLLWM